MDAEFWRERRLLRRWFPRRFRRPRLIFRDGTIPRPSDRENLLKPGRYRDDR